MQAKVSGCLGRCQISLANALSCESEALVQNLEAGIIQAQQGGGRVFCRVWIYTNTFRS